MADVRRRTRSPLGGGREEIEWIGGQMTLPAYVVDGEPYRPKLVVWLEMPTGVVVGHDLVREDGRDHLVGALKEALKRPAVGPRREPARVRVADHGAGAELRNALGDRFEVHVAPTPELDGLFEDFIGHVSDKGDGATYLEGGRVPAAVVARMFDAAAHLYRVAPWKVAADHEVLHMDIPALGVEGACVSIIGALGESLGIIVFASYLAFERFGDAALEVGKHALDLGGPVLALDFWKARDVPSGMRREIARNGWSAVAPDAVPVVTHRDRDGVERPLRERDVRIVTECAFAVASFCVRHPEAFGGRLREPVSESSEMGESGVTVRLTAPYDAADAFFPSQPEVQPPAVRGATVGRNDPCPCGSGKKYKKCCLGTRETERLEERRRAAVHELDEQIVRELGEYALDRYEREWRTALHRFGRAAGPPEPLVVQLSGPWSVYGARIAGKRVVDLFLEQHASLLSPEERSWLTAQQQAWLSLWEVTACEPGVAVTARDPLSAETRRIREVKGSRQLAVRDTVLARVVDYKGASYFCGMYPSILPPMPAAHIVAQLRRRLRSKESVPPDVLREEGLGLAMIRHWANAVRDEREAAARPKKLVNTDGDDLLLTTDHFDFDPADRADIWAKLGSIEGVDADHPAAADGQLTAFKQGNAIHSHWENTVIGHLALTDGRLEVETNSVERADRLREKIEVACGGRLKHRAREHADPLSSARSRHESSRPRPPPSREEEEALQGFREQHYRHWLDEPVPALGGKTPRQAARSRRGLQQVDLLLRTMENNEQRVPDHAPFDFGPLRRELGLDGDTQPTASD
jgi:hypothetical protein